MTPKEQELIDLLSPVLEGMNLQLVDLSSAITNGRRHLVVVVFSNDGVGHDELGKAHKTIQARMQALDPHGYDLSIELSTPGIDRVIKNQWEYKIFTGKGIRILTEDNSDWIYGVLENTDDSSIEISETDGQKRSIAIASIRKAKLDYLQDRR
ncbi:LSm family protein [Spirochaeta dissipatitropha]